MGGLSSLVCCRDGGGAVDLRISAWSRGINPGSVDVPPDTRIEAAIVLRRSRGTY
jgi:hypothetical protein